MQDKELPHWFARFAIFGDLFPVYCGGKDVPDLLHVQNAVSALCFFLDPRQEQHWNTVYNVGGGTLLCVLTLANLY